MAEEVLLDIASTEFSKGRRALADSEESERQEARRRAAALLQQEQKPLAKKTAIIPKVIVKPKTKLIQPAKGLDPSDDCPSSKRPKINIHQEEAAKEEGYQGLGLAYEDSEDDE